MSRWAIGRIGSPLSPTIRKPHPGFTSLNFASLTVSSWVNEAASLVAFAIGYGQSTTRDMAMDDLRAR